MKKKREGRRSRAWLWLLVLLPVIYLGVQVARTVNRPYRTQTALSVTLTDSIQVSGVAVRSETALPQQTGGVVGYTVGDGQRVMVGTEVARIFPNAAAARSFDAAAALTDRINALAAAETDGRNAGTDVNLILQQVDSDMYRYISLLHTGAYSEVAAVSQTLSYALNKLDIAVGREADFSALVAALSAEREALLAQAVATEAAYAPTTGYFAYDTDGLEDLAPDAVTEMTPAQLEALIAAGTGEDVPAVGKMITSYRWYFVFTVGEADAGRFTAGRMLTLDFIDAGVSGLTASVSKVGQPEGGRVAVTLMCEQMDERLTTLRFETAQVEFATYTGIRIPRAALHIDEEGHRGVYIKFGTLVRFRRIDPIFETDAYLLVPLTPGGNNQLSLYDEIILEGTDLFDGKLL